MTDSLRAPSAGGQACPACATAFPATELACPKCQRLAHAAELQQLAQRAAAHARAGDREAELSTWRTVLELLPPASRQHAQISAKLAALVADAPAAPPARTGPSRYLGGFASLAGAGLLLWKFKWLLALALTKGKLLLLGLTKLSTLLSMLLSLGVYWSLWGWQFAAGIVLSIYIHEIGHVAALKRLGIAASAPMFVPGLGAFVRSRQYPASAAEDAEVGLAGPIWGLGAAAACFTVSALWEAPFFAALARTGAWINLFNLLPAWTLDGGRGFRALARNERWLATAVLFGVWVATAEGLLVLLLLAAVVRTVAERGPETGHRRTLVAYSLLVAALAWLSTLDVDTGAR